MDGESEKQDNKVRMMKQDGNLGDTVKMTVRVVKQDVRVINQDDHECDEARSG